MTTHFNFLEKKLFDILKKKPTFMTITDENNRHVLDLVYMKPSGVVIRTLFGLSENLYDSVKQTLQDSDGKPEKVIGTVFMTGKLFEYAAK